MTDDVLDLDIHGLAIEVWPDVERVVRMLFPADSDPGGEWVLSVPHPLAGDPYEITGVADTFGDPERPRVSFTLPADRMRDVMRQRFVISFDGVPKLSGPLRVAAPQAVAGETTVSITLVEPQALAVDLMVIGGGGDVDLSGYARLAVENRFTAPQRIDIDIPVTPLADVATTLPTTMLHRHLPDDGGVLVEDVAFAVDYGGGFVARAIATITAGYDPATGEQSPVSQVDYYGWTGTNEDDEPVYRRAIRTVESAGEVPTIGEILAAAMDTSTLAPVQAGSPVFDEDLTPKAYVDGEVSAAVAAEAAARAAADSAEATARQVADAVIGSDLSAATIRQRMIAQAARSTAPTKWAVCGANSDTKWAAPWQAPHVSTSLVIQTLALVLNFRQPGFLEFLAESLEGLGDKDRYEQGDEGDDADGLPSGAAPVVEVLSYGEGSKADANQEYHRAPTTQEDRSARAPIAVGVWIRRYMKIDPVAHTITLAYEDDTFWDFEENGRRWATLVVYENPEITSVHDGNGYDTWLGRGVGDYLTAEVEEFVDGTGVMHFDPSIAEIGATEVEDSVAESAPGVPVVWVGSGGAEIDGVTAAGGADGASAYEVAVVNGFVGDETAWLASLHGEDGEDGAPGDPTTVDDGAIPQAKVNGLVAALARIGTTVETTSDSPARTSTTYTADGTLQFEGAADTTYKIELYAIFQGDATADLKVGFSTPAGTMHLTVEGALTTVASGSDYDRFLTLTSSAQTATIGIAGASTPIAVRISGVIHLTSAGTVSFGWAPNAAGAGTGVTRLARSQLYYRAA